MVEHAFMEDHIIMGVGGLGLNILVRNNNESINHNLANQSNAFWGKIRARFFNFALIFYDIITI